MPIVMPTPDELAQMEWHARDKVLRKARALLADYAYAYAEAIPRWYRMTEEQREVAEDAKRLRDDLWGQRERETAEALLALMPADAEAASHRVAVGGRSA